MKRKRIIITVVLIVVAISTIAGYKLIKFQEERFKIVDDSDIPIFAENMKIAPILYPNLEKFLLNEETGKFTKIENLENLTNLTNFAIFGPSSENKENANNTTKRIDKLEGLENQHNLEEIMILDERVGKLEGLSGLNHITDIDLEGNNITTIENVETIPLIENDYCYTIKDGGSYKKFGENKINNDGVSSEYCYLDAEPKEYESKRLYNEKFKYGEKISPLITLRLEDNPITGITQESLDYIEKNKIYVGFNDRGASPYNNYLPFSSLDVI